MNESSAMPATTTSTPMITSCDVENERRTLSSLFLIWVASISDLHPHDLLVGLDGLVSDGHRHLDGELGLGGRGHVHVDVAELPGGELLAELVGLVQALLDLVQPVGERVAVDLVGRRD